MTGKAAVILDRDGTVIAERHYLADPAQVELIPGTGAALRELAAHGLPLLLVTNQSGVGRGYFDAEVVGRVHERLAALLEVEEARFSGVYVCPHTPDDRCDCRKPATGLIDRAMQEHDFDPRASFVVGDKACDIELGKRIGAVTLLVSTGYGSETAATANADHVVRDLAEAAAVIIEICRKRA